MHRTFLLLLFSLPAKEQDMQKSRSSHDDRLGIFLTTVSDVVSGIQEGTVADDFKVTVVSRSPSGLSDITDDLSLRYLLTGVNSKAAAMRISGLGSIPMIDQDIISVTVGPACISDGSAFGSPPSGLPKAEPSLMQAGPTVTDIMS